MGRAPAYPEAVDLVRDLVLAGMTRRNEVHAELKRHLPANVVPNVRTTGNYIRKALEGDRSEPWSLATASGESAALVLPALGEAIRRSRGSIRHLTRAEATWVLRLRQADAELPPWEALRLARRYLRASDLAVAELDRYVALRLWNSGKNLSNALQLGIVSSRVLDPLGSEIPDRALGDRKASRSRRRSRRAPSSGA